MFPSGRVSFQHSSHVTRSFPVWVAVLIAVVLGSFAYGQSGAGQTPAGPTIVTNVDEVSFDLVVRDKKNKAVLDLKPEDITVMDKGAPVKIADLRLLNGKSGS